MSSQEFMTSVGPERSSGGLGSDQRDLGSEKTEPRVNREGGVKGIVGGGLEVD